MLDPTQQRMQVRVDGILLADSTNTLELHEHGYPPHHYFPLGWSYEQLIEGM